MALAERPAGPAGVDEPDVDVWMRLELRTEQVRIDGRWLRQERRPEARRERGLRLGDADLRPGELCREPREEPVHGLVASQSRDGREDPECVGGEKDDGAGMAAALCGEGIGDLLELVRGSGVLGLRVVVEVEDATLVHHHVLEHRAERARRRIDLRLRLA